MILCHLPKTIRKFQKKILELKTSRRSFLYLEKVGESFFDINMGAVDGAEFCDLAGLSILSILTHFTTVFHFYLIPENIRKPEVIETEHYLKIRLIYHGDIY